MAWNDLNKAQKKKYQLAFGQLYGDAEAIDEALIAKKPRKPRGCLTEESEHIKCVNFLRSKNIYFHHSPNGERRSLHVGAKLKRMGVKPGWPDFEILYPTQLYHGLFVELKALDGHLSPVQREVLKELNDRGYKSVCVHGFDKFKQVVEDYFL